MIKILLTYDYNKECGYCVIHNNKYPKLNLTNNKYE